MMLRSLGFLGAIGFLLFAASTVAASDCMLMVCVDLEDEGPVSVEFLEGSEEEAAAPAPEEEPEDAGQPSPEEDAPRRDARPEPAQPLVDVAKDAVPIEGLLEPISPLLDLDLVTGKSPQGAPREDEAQPSTMIIAAEGLSQAITEPAPPTANLLLATAIAGTTAGAGYWLAPGLRGLLLRWAGRFAGIGLFSRLSESAILNHRTRGDILEFVRGNPGERVEVMRQSLGLSNGTLLYHLRVLRNSNLVRLHKEGALARLYPAGPRIQPTPYVPPLRRRILSLLHLSPGPTQKQVAASLQLSERMVSYHVRELHRQGLLEVQRAGCAKMLYPARATVQAAPASP